MRKSILIPWILLLILAAALGYVIFYQSKNQTAPPAVSSQNYADQNQWKTWQDGYYSQATDMFYGYELSYPRDFDVSSLDQASGGLLPGGTRVKIAFPQDAFKTPPTNFGEGFVTVSVATGAQATEASCYEDPYGQAMTETENLNGQEFRFATSTGVGAGQIYTSKVFRTIAHDRCYEMAETIHTGNIGNYTPGAVTEFDKSQAWSVLDKIADTFKLYTKTGPGQ